MPGLVNVGLLCGRLGQRRHQTTTPRGALRPRRGGGQTPRSDEKKHVFNGDFWCFFYKGNPKGEQWNNDLKCCQQQKMWKTMLPEKRKWVVLVVLLKVASFFWQSFQGWPGFGVCMRLWQSEKKRRWFCSGCSKAFPKNLHQDVLDMKLQSSRNRALCYDRYHKSIFPWNLISLRNIRRIRSTKVMFLQESLTSGNLYISVASMIIHFCILRFDHNMWWYWCVGSKGAPFANLLAKQWRLRGKSVQLGVSCWWWLRVTSFFGAFGVPPRSLRSFALIWLPSSTFPCDWLRVPCYQQFHFRFLTWLRVAKTL